MKFKKGDRVKFIGVAPTKFIGKIGVIDEIRPVEREFPYSILIEGRTKFPVLAYEIEKVPTKGEQLLLFEL